LIAGNTSHGIAIQRDAGSDPTGAQLSIFSNFIGTDDTNTIQMGNGGDGVTISGAVRGSMIFNSIAYNAGRGIVVAGPLTTNGHGIQMRSGKITSNGGLGIDIGNDGRTPNDADDSDDGANALLNFPVLTEAGVDGSTGLLQFAGTVQARPNWTYLIEFFKVAAANNRPNGYEAPQILHSASIVTNASGVATFSYTKANGGVVGDKIVAMLHDQGKNASSEISDQFAVTLSLPAITGKITREGGTVVKNLTVQLSGTQSATTVTDTAGNYVFTGLAVSGNYTVTPLDPGYTYTPATRNYTNLTTSQTANFTGISIPATYTVNVTHDAGDGSCSPAECTLREAIATANDHPGADTISFAVPGNGPHALVVDSLLPNLSSDLVIDGYTQSGAFVNTKVTGGLNSVLKIALARGALSSQGAHALQILGSRITIRGLAIGGFPIGIYVPQNPSQAINDVVIVGNFLGTTPDGLAAAPNSEGGIIALSGAGITIGGSTPAARNLISGHIGSGVHLTAGFNGRPSNIVVRGNLIGTDVTGQAALPNDVGLSFFGTNSAPEADVLRIGGDAPGERNVISGNVNAIQLSSGGQSNRDDSDLQVVGNFIGVAADGVTPLGNTDTGISISGRVKSRVTRNVIAHNGGNGVTILTVPTTAGKGVDLSENRIFLNAFYAIDLGADQRTDNDADDSDTGSNDLQNKPALASMIETVSGTQLTGTLTSRPNRTYRIEVFTTNGAPLLGEMAYEFVESFQVTTGADGIAPISRMFTRAFAANEWFTATATDVDAMMTSELSFLPIFLTPLERADVTTTITLNGAPMAGVDVALTGDRQATAKTDASGVAVFSLPVGGNYLLTPAATGYVFTPPSAQVTNLAVATAVNFTARRATFTRYLPEGATGSFWGTSISLLNAGTTATTATMSFLLPDGTKKQIDVPMTAPGHAVIDPSTTEGLESATFSTVVESTEPLAVSRTTRWGDQRELGAHAEQALNEPRMSWYFAEGTTGCFDLFYLLVNPNASPAEVEITFVRRAPELPIVKRYTIGAFSRSTIRVNEEEGLSSAEVSARIEGLNGQPIVAERAMYSRCFGANWRGGHDAVASEAPSSDWFFAEGATGNFFDLYLLLANFGTQTSNVEIDYLFDNGSTLTKQYDVPAGSRVTVDVANESPELSSAAVSAIVRAPNAAPVVAERAQWWPHGAWYEGHVSAGVVQPGIEWQIAGAEVGGSHDAQSFLLIANTSDGPASAQVRVVFNDGTTEMLSEPIALGARSRTTLSLREAFPNSADRTFGVVIESLGATPAPIVAELSTYSNTTGADGVTRFWGAGTNIVATRVR
jgi:CSLREA domain-containing protein